MDMPLMQKSRAKGPRSRSRTGCKRCKIRHLKCGEEKPSCLRCIRSAIPCEYFLTFAPVSWATSSIGRVIISPARSGKDSRGFDYFRNNTLSGLLGFGYDSEFWNQIVLQFCEASPAVLSAVLSLGALHENLLNKTEAKTTSNNDTVFLEQYNKSIRCLQSSLESRPVVSTLICCVIFICLEYFSGNYDKALAHLQSGLTILENWRKEGIRSASELKVRENLLQMFRRRKLQACVFMNSRKSVIHIITFGERNSEDESPLPASFLNLQQAQEKLDRIMMRMMYVLQLKYPAIESATRPFLLQGLAARFSSWKKAFDSYLKRESQNMITKDLRLSVGLELHFRTAFVRLDLEATSVLHKEEINSKFTQIINLSRCLLKSRDPMKPSYSSEIGVIAPLSLTAMNASPYLRQQTIELLRTVNGMEGPLDSITVSRIAEKVMIAEGTNEPGIPVTVSVQYLAEAHQFPAERIQERQYDCLCCPFPMDGEISK